MSQLLNKDNDSPSVINVNDVDTIYDDLESNVTGQNLQKYMLLNVCFIIIIISIFFTLQHRKYINLIPTRDNTVILTLSTIDLYHATAHCVWGKL